MTITDRDGNTQVWQYDAPAGLKTREVVQTNREVRSGEGDYVSTWTYDDERSDLVTRTVPSDTAKLMAYAYDANGQLTAKTIAYERDGVAVTQAAWYDAEKALYTRRQDVDGRESSYEYDADYNLLTYTGPSVSMGQPTAQTASYTYEYNGMGQVTRSVSPLGAVMAAYYDSCGNRTKQINDVGGLNLTLQMRYDAFGNLTEAINPAGAKTWYHYADGALLTKEARILDNSDPSKQYAVAYYYNTQGLLASKKVDHKDQSGNALTPAQYVCTYLYDLQGHMTRETYQLDATNILTRYTYYNGEGAVSKRVNANGTEEGYVYDERNLIYEKENCGSCGSSSAQYLLDGTGRTTRELDAEGNATVMVYDGFERITRRMQYDNGAPAALLLSEELAYDSSGNVTQRTVRDASATVLTRSSFYYDELNRNYETRNWATPSAGQSDADSRIVSLYDAASLLTKERTYLDGTDASPIIAETTYYYDGEGRLTRQVDAEGFGRTVQYDGAGNVTRETDALGHATVSQYDALGRLTRRTGPDGAYVVTEYDSLDNALTRISCTPGGTALAKEAYDYDALGQQTLARRFADPTGAADDGTDARSWTYYDAHGLVTRTVDALGHATTVCYDAYNRRQWERDALGNKAEYVYDGNNRVITRITYTIDQLSGATKTVRAASLYDGRGRLTKTVTQGPDGDITLTADNGETAYYYDVLSRQTRTVDVMGVASVNVFDGLGRVTRRTADAGGLNAHTDSVYDRGGRVVTSLNPLGHTTSYTYDNLGRATRVTGSLGDYQATYYDAVGRTTRSVAAEQDTVTSTWWTVTVDQWYDAAGRITRASDQGPDGDIAQTADNNVTTDYYDGLGRVTRQVDALGVASASCYDGLGRVTRRIADVGGLDAHVDSLYDAGGRLTKQADPNGNATTFTYDALGRSSRTTDALGNYAIKLYGGYSGDEVRSMSYEIDMVSGSTKSFTVDSLHDGLGRLTKTTNQGADGDITQTADNIETVMVYDSAGRMTHVTDAEGMVRARYYDALGRMTRQTDDVGGLDRHVDRIYDLAGRMTRITDALNQSTDYAYDAKGRLTRTAYEDHDGAADTVDLWYVGSLQRKRQDQRGIVTRYDYDGLGRLTSKQDDWTSPVIVETYAHDAMGRATRSVLSRSGTEQSECGFAYDNLGRQTRESLQIKNGTMRHVDVMYDLAGNRTKLAYPGGKTVNYTVDALNRISVIADGADDRAVYAYVGASRRSQMLLKDGATTLNIVKMSYDGMGRVTSYLYRNSDDTATGFGFEHGYDKMGNPLYEARVTLNDGDEYTYDSLYRITRAVYQDATPTTPTANPANSKKEDFLVDLIGNRTKLYAKSAAATAYAHNAVNEYTAIGGTPYEYDAAGNLTKDGTRYYYWDYENRLTKVKLVSDSSDVAEYTYDAQRRRVETIGCATDVTMRFYLDGWSVLEERDGSDVVQAEYVLGPRIDEYVTMTRNGKTYRYQQSPLTGNVWNLSSSEGGAESTWYYDVYGRHMTIVAGGTESYNPYWFTGRREEFGTTFMYFRNRMYDPDTGRFVNRDPIGYKDGMSLYLAYFAPSGRDPMGLWKRLKDHQWRAEQGDTLWSLAAKEEYGGDGGNHVCLWPVTGIARGYPNTIRPCDTYDASNLATPAPRATDYRVIVAQDQVRGFRSVFGNIPYLRADRVAAKIKEVSNQGGTPIRYLLVAGHSGRDGMAGPVENGEWARFRAKDLTELSEAVTYDRAKQRQGPVRCWFARNATAVFPGCNSSNVMAEPFATGVLRRGAAAWGTTMTTGWWGGQAHWDYVLDEDGEEKAQSHGDWGTAPFWKKYGGKK